MAVTHNPFYDLDDTAAPSEPPVGWAQLIAGGTRTGININTGAGVSKFYTRNDLAIGAGENWAVETAVSAPGVGGAGERGARMSIKLTDPTAFMLPPAGLNKYRHVELRLEEDGAGNRRFSLVDGNAGTEMASLALDWTDEAPRWRIRIKREGTDIIMEAEPAHTGPLMTDPLNLPLVPPNSVTVPVANFSFPAGTFDEFGFGHFVAGSYNSYWENIHICRANDADTKMPYWPPRAEAPTTLDWVDTGLDNPAGQDVDIELDLSTGVADTVSGGTSNDPYLTDDVAEIFIHAAPVGGTPVDIADPATATNPSAAPGLHARTFNGLSDDQNANANAVAGPVTGWATVTEVYGRSTQGTTGSVSIPDRTSPQGVIRIVRANLPGDFMQSLLGTYNDVNQPVQICVDVTERHLDEANSSLVIEDQANTYQNSTTLAALTAAGNRDDISPPSEPGTVWRYRWPVSSMPDPLREWAWNDPTGSVNTVTVTLQDDSGQTQVGSINHDFELNTQAPTGTIVVAPDPGGGTPPAFGDFGPIPPAPGNLYGVANGLFVGVLLSAGNHDDLAWGDGIQPGSVFPSEMNLDSLVPPDRDLDLNAGFAEVSSGTNTVIYWATALTSGTYNAGFVLEDLAGNATTIPAEQFLVDSVAPDVSIEVNDGGGWVTVPPGTYPSGTSVQVRITTSESNPKTTADAAPRSYIEIDDGTIVNTQEFGAGVQETPPGSGQWLFTAPDPAITADGTYTIRARVYDQAGLASPIDTRTVEVAAVAAPKFFIAGSQTQSANAVTVSWTNDNNTNLQANGLMRSGASNHNYIGVRISNDPTGGPGDCKYRHFLIPACLFTGTDVWKLITTGAAGVVPAIAPGTQKDSVGNVDYHEGLPTFPDMSDPAWGPIAVGSLLHTCTAVVLHSSADPLMVPDGGGGTMPIQDAWFDTIDPSPTPPWAAGTFQAEILGRIDAYNGSTGGFWTAVTANPKIANRNINIQNTGT